MPQRPVTSAGDLVANSNVSIRHTCSRLAAFHGLKSFVHRIWHAGLRVHHDSWQYFGSLPNPACIGFCGLNHKLLNHKLLQSRCLALLSNLDSRSLPQYLRVSCLNNGTCTHQLSLQRYFLKELHYFKVLSMSEWNVCHSFLLLAITHNYICILGFLLGRFKTSSYHLTEFLNSQIQKLYGAPLKRASWPWEACFVHVLALSTKNLLPTNPGTSQRNFWISGVLGWILKGEKDRHLAMASSLGKTWKPSENERQGLSRVFGVCGLDFLLTISNKLVAISSPDKGSETV